MVEIIQRTASKGLPKDYMPPEGEFVIKSQPHQKELDIIRAWDLTPWYKRILLKILTKHYAGFSVWRYAQIKKMLIKPPESPTTTKTT